jgi:NAD(P) transhydrogenase subunit alpha
VVGALLAVTASTLTANDPGAALISRILGFFALTMVCVNIFGGFLVTQRMLAMYKKKEK